MERIRATFQNLTQSILAADRGSRILQIAGMVRFAFILLQGVILVKAGVPLLIIGQIELIFFVANFLTFYWQNGGKNAMLAWHDPHRAGESDTAKLGPVFITMHLYGIVAVIIIGMIALFALPEKYAFIISGEGLVYMCIYVFFTLPATPLIYAYLIRQQYRRIIAYIIVAYGLQVLCVLVPVLLNLEVIAVLQILAIFAFLRWIFTCVDGHWFDAGFPKKARVAGFFVFALPLVLHALSSGLMDYVDGWIVSWFYGTEQFAVYRFGAKEFPVNALLIGGLTAGLIHQFRSTHDIVPGQLKEEIRRLMRILFPVNCLLLLLSPLLYELVYSSDFIESARIFNIYALTLLSRVVVNQVYLYVYQHNWVLSISTAIEVLLNIVLSILFMHWMGLPGIPLATVVAFAAHKLFLFIYVGRKFNAPVPSYLPVKRYALYSMGMIACFVISEFLYFNS